MSEAAAKTFLAPLSLLAFRGQDLRASLAEGVVTWAIERAAESDELGEPSPRNEAWERGWVKGTDDNLVAAAETLGVCHGDRGRFMRDSGEVKRFVRDFEQRFGGDRQVRLLAPMVWEVVQGKTASRDLLVLAGVFAALGVRSYRRITIDEIIRGASACKSSAVFNEWVGKLPPLSRDQVRYTLDGLEGRNLFVRFCYRQRQTFFASATTGHETLVEMVTRSKVKAATAGARRRADALASAEIDRRILALSSPIQAGIHKSGPHNSGDSSSGESPHASPTFPQGVPTSSP